MREFYNNIITFLNSMDPLVKVLLVGILLILDIFAVIKVIKTHVAAKKSVFKIGQFILLAILIFLTIFICMHI